MPSLSPKSVSGNEIPCSKVDESAPRIMLKAAFVEEVDDNNTNFEHASCIRVFSTRYNQTQGSLMGRNVAGLPVGQGLSEVESLKKNNLMNSYIAVDMVSLTSYSIKMF